METVEDTDDPGGVWKLRKIISRIQEKEKSKRESIIKYKNSKKNWGI